MTNEKHIDSKIDKGISEIVGALTDPIIAYPGAWMDTIPDWVKDAIPLERLVMNMKALKGEEMTGTDAEALAYMMPASMEFPLNHDWTQIYLYLATTVMTRHKKTEVPDDIKVESLTDDQMRDLDRLKEWIYRRRVQARQEKDRAERRQQREEAVAKKEALQPKMFDF